MAALYDNFWFKADDIPAGALPSVEHTEEEEEDNEDRISLSHHTNQIVSEDHGHGEGTIISPRSILGMRIERKEVVWSKLSFEPKAQSHQCNADWVMEVLSLLNVSNSTGKVGTKKAWKFQSCCL